MSYGPYASTTALSWARLRARGDDAESFLQGQVTQDLATIDGPGAWSLLLAPDSVVVAGCFVTRAEGGFDLVLESSSADAALARLRRFLLRARCEMTIDEAERGPFATVGDRVEDRWPGANEFASGLAPHSYGRRVVDATISFTKGCFTGQELVGRLDARGASVPWRLVAVDGATVNAVRAVLERYGPEGPKGPTTLVERDGRVVGLGFAHRTLLAASWDDDVVVRAVA